MCTRIRDGPCRARAAAAPMSMVHVENCAVAHLLAAYRADASGVGGRAFFACDFDENIVSLYRALGGRSPPMATLPYWLLSALVHLSMAAHLLLLTATGGRVQLLGPKKGLHHGALAAALPCTVRGERARRYLGYATQVTRAVAVASCTRPYAPLLDDASVAAAIDAALARCQPSSADGDGDAAPVARSPAAASADKDPSRGGEACLVGWHSVWLAVLLAPLRLLLTPLRPILWAVRWAARVALSAASPALRHLVGRLLGIVEPFARGDSTAALLVRGFAIRRRHAVRLEQLARTLHARSSGPTSVRGKTILVTGSARGLGAGVAAHLAAAGARLVLPQRSGADAAEMRAILARSAAEAVRACASSEDDAASPPTEAEIDVSCPHLELGSLRSIDACVGALRAEGIVLDAVINNAGMVPIASGRTADGFEPAFGINYLGTAHLTLSLVQSGVLKPGATIVNVSSEEHRLASVAFHRGVPLAADHADAGAPGVPSAANVPLGAVPSNASIATALERYAYSKLLVTIFSHELARRIPYRVRDVCPGPVASEIARDAPWPIGPLTQYGMWLTFPSPADAALPVIELLLPSPPHAAAHTDGGAVHYHMSEACRAGARANEAAVGAWLWEQTAALLETKEPPAEPPAAA